jgi:hypothetical protein
MLSVNHILGKPYTTFFTPHLLSDDHKGAHACYKQCPGQEHVPPEEDYYYDEFGEV